MITVLAAGPAASTGEAVLFWVLAPLATLAALVMLASKKAVHSALGLALTMGCLAILYIAQGAVFLGIVQVVIYTGAVLMLFLFVLMLVGVAAADSLVETLPGQRWAAAAAGLGFGSLLITALMHASLDNAAGLTEAQTAGNVSAVATRIFTRYVWAFEVTGALLIVAAVGAMVLTSAQRHTARTTQRELATQRFRAGKHVTPLPGPGVYARHNAVDVPALLPDGSPASLSVPSALAQREDVSSPPVVAPPPSLGRADAAAASPAPAIQERSAAENPADEEGAR